MVMLMKTEQLFNVIVHIQYNCRRTNDVTCTYVNSNTTGLNKRQEADMHSRDV